MFSKKIVAIALLLLVSFASAEKEDDSLEQDDDSFYDSRGEFSSIFVRMTLFVVLKVVTGNAYYVSCA